MMVQAAAGAGLGARVPPVFQRGSGPPKCRGERSGRMSRPRVPSATCRMLSRNHRRGRGWVFAGKFADARIRALERLILHEHCLHERIDRVRRMRQSIRDCAFGFRVAWRILKPGKPVEQIRQPVGVPVGSWRPPVTIGGVI